MLKSVTTSATLRSPLHAFELDKRVAQHSEVFHGVRISELGNLGYIIVRGRSSDPVFVDAMARVLGAPLPLVPSTFATCREGVIQWVSPDEWWIVCSRAKKDGLFDNLKAALSGQFAQVVDNSGGHAAIRVTGPKHIMLLRHLGPYDFESLEYGQAISTVAGKANVTVLRTDETGVVILFRRSFADYFWRLISKAARPHGLCIVTPKTHADPLITPMVAAAKG